MTLRAYYPLTRPGPGDIFRYRLLDFTGGGSFDDIAGPGRALYLNGAEYTDISTSTATTKLPEWTLPHTADWTIGMWVRSAWSGTGVEYVLSFGNFGNVNSFVVYGNQLSHATAPGKMRIHIEGETDSTEYGAVTGDNTVQANQWILVVARYRAADKLLECLVYGRDGQLKGSGSVTCTNFSGCELDGTASTNHPLRLGSPQTVGNYLTGYVHSLTKWDRRLTDQQLRQWARDPFGPFRFDIRTRAASKSILAVILTAAMGASATVAKQLSAFRSLTAGLTSSAVVSKVGQFARSLTAGLTSGAAISKVGQFARSLSASMGTSAVVSKVGQFARSLTTGIGMAASITTSTALSVYLSATMAMRAAKKTNEAFWETFKGGQFNSSSPWTWTSDGAGNAVVDTDAEEGTHCLKVRYPEDWDGGSGNNGIYFNLSGQPKEVWIEWMVKYPTDWRHPHTNRSITGEGASDASISSGSQVLTCSGATFSAKDKWKIVKVTGAGVAGADLNALIQSVDSATQVTLDRAASTTVSGALWNRYTIAYPNWKWFSIEGAGYERADRPKFLIEILPINDDAYSSEDSWWQLRVVENGSTSLGGIGYVDEQDVFGTLFGTNRLVKGQWSRVRIHLNIGSYSDGTDGLHDGTGDGVMEVWLGTTKILDRTNACFYPMNLNPGVTDAPYWSQGNIFGAANDPIVHDQDVMFDSLRVWTENPGWGGFSDQFFTYMNATMSMAATVATQLLSGVYLVAGMGMSAAVSTAGIFARAASATMGMTATAARQLQASRAVSATMSLAATVVTSLQLSRILSATMGTSASIGRQLLASRAVQATMGMTAQVWAVLQGLIDLFPSRAKSLFLKMFDSRSIELDASDGRDISLNTDDERDLD